MAPQHEPYPNCLSAGRIATGLLFSFLALASPITAALKKPAVLQDAAGLDGLPVVGPGPVYSTPGNQVPHEKTHRFTLRNIFHHGIYLHPSLHRRKDVSGIDTSLWRQAEDGFVVAQDSTPIVARSMSTKIERLVDRRPSVVDPMVAAAREEGEVWTLSPSAWTIDEVPGPNITDKETIIAFARMAANAYIEIPGTEEWEDIHDGGFDSGAHFGWQGDGLRGHVFTDEDNSTIVISLKGTSLALWDGAETTTNDKENDNLFFSCCCAQQGQLTWRKVCNCATATYACNSTCLIQSLRSENRYYQAALDLYSNITVLYPDSNIWITGHSLGGAVSSLLGMTYGLPTVTFEAPGEALAAKRLGLPAPPGSDPDSPQTREFTGVYHFGHTADPIYLGVCNGATGSCTYYGYAMETACHSGYECVYDVATDKGWRVGIGTHRIHVVIDDVIKKYETVPQCVTTPECTDCALWKYFESNSSDPTTTSTSTTSKTRTRTATCQTPGWWGCLDETTSTSGTATSQITTTTTSSTSCKTPGWFGCYDKTTTTTTTATTATTTSPSGVFTPTSTQSLSAPTTSCQSPGYWGGCNDSSKTSPPSSTTAVKCETPGIFWGCKDRTATSTMSHSITSPPVLPSTTTSPSATKDHKCTSKAWFGLVCADPSPTSTVAGTPAPSGEPTRQQKCRRRGWLGNCKEWEDIGEAPSQEI